VSEPEGNGPPGGQVGKPEVDDEGQHVRQVRESEGNDPTGGQVGKPEVDEEGQHGGQVREPERDDPHGGQVREPEVDEEGQHGGQVREPEGNVPPAAKDIAAAHQSLTRAAQGEARLRRALKKHKKAVAGIKAK
jgi:hypothetical protein